jgi:hypothetical protein
MTVEIGSLIVRGTFGADPSKSSLDPDRVREEMLVLRQEILGEVNRMMSDLERRRSDR